MTFSEVKAIWGHEVKLPISVIWRRNTCLWVGVSCITRKMTLGNIVCYIEIGIKWIYGTAWYYVQMPWKVSIFHIQNAIKTAFLKGITRNLLYAFFREYSSTYILFFENLKICFFLPKKMLNNFQISKSFTVSKTRDCGLVANSFLSIPNFYNWLYR